MYAYVFDHFAQEQKYRTESSRIETRLATLGIQGRTEKMTILKNIQDSVRTLLKRGADTVVIIGNDLTVTKILPLLIESDTALGLIPLGPQQLIARALGIPDGVAACDMLSRRIMRRIDLGLVGGAHFLLRADLPLGARVLCDGAYTVQANDAESPLAIVNLGQAGLRSHPDDGRLELVVGTPGGNWFSRGGKDQSVFPITQAKIERLSGEARVILDGQLAVNTPATVTVQKKKLHVIVGRERSFD